MERDGVEGAIPHSTREWIESVLARLDMVEWDRFVVGDDHNLAGHYVEVYGWIDRTEDEYKDFVTARFWTGDKLIEFTTSSDRYTQEIHRRIYGDDPPEHNPCQRVEHTFGVPNAVELGGGGSE